ncbi:hypothetical protein HOY82DRAFT_541496 [Tuber indicum]|nr:hypothetical protein HOY82DRAFT_541496 [Tuber indicum]
MASQAGKRRIGNTRYYQPDDMQNSTYSSRISMKAPHPSTVSNRSRLPDGSISPDGYFNGLNLDQAKRSMDLIKEEYNLYIQNSSTQQRTRTPLHFSYIPIRAKDGTAGSTVYDQPAANDKELNSFTQLRESWTERGWTTAFSLCQKYDADSNLPPIAWNKLLTWLWNSMEEGQMAELHAIINRLRYATVSLPDLDYSITAGQKRTPLQQDLIHDYHKVVRSVTIQDVSCVTQRLVLAQLYRSHGAYVTEYRNKGYVLQTARQRVNTMLFNIFNKELGTRVSLQTINNHVKEGRHWSELLEGSFTKGYGYGLLLLLPVRGYSEIARKTADPVWSFLVHHFHTISPRICKLAKALDPIARSIETRGIGYVNVPLIGYELREATNLHTLSDDQFLHCLKSYPELGILQVHRIIARHGRVLEPDTIKDLVEQELEEKKQQELEAFEERAAELQKLVDKDMNTMELVEHDCDSHNSTTTSKYSQSPKLLPPCDTIHVSAGQDTRLDNDKDLILVPCKSGLTVDTTSSDIGGISDNYQTVRDSSPTENNQQAGNHKERMPNTRMQVLVANSPSSMINCCEPEQACTPVEDIGRSPIPETPPTAVTDCGSDSTTDMIHLADQIHDL